jgi:hypothetical protein
MKFFTPKNVQAVLAVWISFVFLQSGFFKFSNAPETQHIFSTVGQWMTDTLHPILGELMTTYGASFIGLVEYIASGLLLVPVIYHLLGKPCACGAWKTLFGAFLAWGTMTGAIFFHLFTPLGVAVQPPGLPSDGGTLFAMAVSVWVSASLLLYWNRTVVLK